MSRQSYNRKNEPKERDKKTREKKSHAINNDSVTTACDLWLETRGLGKALGTPAPKRLTESRVRIIKTNGKFRSATPPPVSMHDMIMPARVAHLARRRERNK